MRIFNTCEKCHQCPHRYSRSSRILRILTGTEDSLDRMTEEDFSTRAEEINNNLKLKSDRMAFRNCAVLCSTEKIKNSSFSIVRVFSIIVHQRNHRIVKFLPSLYHGGKK